MTPGKPLRKADFITSIFFILLGSGVIFQASRMPWRVQSAGLAQDWYLSPGLFPAVLGSLLILFSLSVLAHAVRQGGHRDLIRFLSENVAAIDGNRDLHRILIAITLMAVYIFVGIGKLNYYVASSAFLCAAMFIFYRPNDSTMNLRLLIKILVISVAAPAIIGYVFSEFFQVPMP